MDFLEKIKNCFISIENFFNEKIKICLDPICIFFKNHEETIFQVTKVILVITFIVLCICIVMFVLLQRGDEGAFSKNRGDKIATDNKTLLRMTVVISGLLFFNAMLLNGLIHVIKHKQSKHSAITVNYDKTIDNIITKKEQ
jgi:protein translocase SecG subunit